MTGPSGRTVPGPGPVRGRLPGLPRPLDPFGSLKAKLGVLVAAAVAAGALATWFGLLELGWRARYTLPVAVLLALAVTQVLAHGMTSPLREMTAAARAMARGEYGRRVTASSRDEVGELGRAFNRMAADLAQVDRERRDLVASVSHELRTPVSALQAVLENLVDGVSPADPATLRSALAQTERLGRLVAELLDLSRVDAGVLPVHKETVPLGAFLASVAAEPRGERDHVEVRVDVDPPDLAAYADPARLHQVVANLLDNARRHSPDGVPVTVTARRDGGRDGEADGGPETVVLEVADAGPGIAPDDREHVFSRFARGRTDGDGGTGLGLAIARWAVDLHGGDIAVVDAERGCRIRVSIPGRTP